MRSHLLIAHGSPDSRHRESMQLVAKAVDARLPSAEVAFIEHDVPRVDTWLSRCAPGDEVVALGMLLAPGYHATTDVPRLLAKASGSVSVVDRGALGTGPWLNSTLEWLVRDVGGDRRTPVVLAVAGSTRPEARESLAAFATQWRLTRSGRVKVAAATGPGPSLDDIVASESARDGAPPVIVPLMIAPGVLADRAIAIATRHGVSTTSTLAEAPHFADAVAERLAG